MSSIRTMPGRLLRAAGLAMPDTFEEVERNLAAGRNKDGVPAFIVENHYGWTFIPCAGGVPAAARCGRRCSSWRSAARYSG